MSEDYWRLWILGAPPSRGMTTSKIANRNQAPFSRRASSPERCKPCHVKREGRGGHGKRGVVPLFPYALRPSRQSQKINKEIKEAERRQTLIRILRILRCGSRLMKARSSDGVPPRLSPKGIIPSQRLSFRPGFLGRGLNGRYPPSPVPVQGSTSHPGRNAGRHDAQAARERTANPPASTAPAPPHGLPPVGVLQVSRIFAFNLKRRSLSNAVAELETRCPCKSLKQRLCCRETLEQYGADTRCDRKR